MKARCILALVFAAGLAYSQPKKAAPKAAPPKPAAAKPAPAQQPQSFPIVGLTVEGNKLYASEKILALAGLKLGTPVSKEAFEGARDKLVNSGYFESVGYKYGPSPDKSGYAATFAVVEVQQAYPMKFVRLPETPEQLRAALAKEDPLFSEKVPGTQQVLKRFEQILQAHLGAKFKDRVVAKVSAEGAGDLEIVFQPATMPPSVAEVRFTKNDVIPTTALQNKVAGAAVGAVYDEKRFRQILDASIRPMYEARGRIRVEFPNITTEPVMDVNGLRVTVEVAEGETYTLGDVAITNQDIPTADLIKAGNLKPGDIANFDEINTGVERMRQVYRRNGFLNSKASTERKLDDKEKKVHITISIDPGTRYMLAGVKMVGLDIITEPHIRKMWGAKEGAPFNPEYPDYFLAKVREEGVLEGLGKTRSEVKMDDAKGTAEVTLFFGGEAPPQKKRRELR